MFRGIQNLPESDQTTILLESWKLPASARARYFHVVAQRLSTYQSPIRNDVVRSVVVQAVRELTAAV
jgi:hypothetical protein